MTQLEALVREAKQESGRVILLRSPRAGYGKTLLLQSLRSSLGDEFKFLAAEPTCGGKLDAHVVLESVLRQLTGILPASGGLTELDFFARRLLAVGLRPLLVSGEIPSHDREGAIFALENRPVETFDFHHQQAATAHWTQSNFEVLGPRLAAELSEKSGAALRDASYWIDLLFRFATTAPERVERTRQLTEAVFAELKTLGSGMAEERLHALFCLLGLVEPVVLVFDETEGLSNQPEDGLRVAAFLVQVRQACPDLTLILSVNQDVWETGFEPLMPGGLRDRLTEYPVDLVEASEDEAKALVKGRFGADAEAILARMSFGGGLFARDIMREASRLQKSLASEGSDDTSKEKESVPVPPALPTVLEPLVEKEEPSKAEQKTADFAAPVKPSEVEQKPVPAVEEVVGNPFETEAESESPFKAVPQSSDSETVAVEPEVDVPRQMVDSGIFGAEEPKPVIDVEPQKEPAEPVFSVPDETIPENLPDPFGLRSGSKEDEVVDEPPILQPEGFSQKSQEEPVKLPWDLPGEAVAKDENSSESKEGIFENSFQQTKQAEEVPRLEESPFRVAEDEASAPARPSQPLAPKEAGDEGGVGNPFDLASAPPSSEPNEPSKPSESPFQPTEPPSWEKDLSSAWKSEKTASEPESAAIPPAKAEANPFERVDDEAPSADSEPAAASVPEGPGDGVADSQPVSSPFSATPQISGDSPQSIDDEAAKVEDLLNQFKRRFGQGE
ncbi:MAG: hypothetical protein Q7Q71_02990 [Verrucomicrobiota bacterium JB023]|nr:hypothetical protein [Verrucomicrobiota bacterium JB023]